MILITIYFLFFCFYFSFLLFLILLGMATKKQVVTQQAEGMVNGGPKQGAGNDQETNNPKEMNIPKVMNIQVQPPKVVVEEGCKTPTWSGNQIPTPLKCPPAPKKKRTPPRRSSAIGLNFFNPSREEIELFFKTVHEFAARAQKMRRSSV